MWEVKFPRAPRPRGWRLDGLRAGRSDVFDRQVVKHQRSSGQTPSGQTSSGRTSSGQTSSGQTSSGQTSSGQTRPSLTASAARDGATAHRPARRPPAGPAQRRLRFGRSAGPGSRHRARGGPERFALPTKRCDLVARSRAKARSRGPPVGSSESETVRTVLARCLPDPCGPMRPWGTVGEICALASSALGSE